LAFFSLQGKAKWRARAALDQKQKKKRKPKRRSSPHSIKTEEEKAKAAILAALQNLAPFTAGVAGAVTVPTRREMPMATKKVLSVGQCAADHTSLRWLLQGEFNAIVVPARTADDALAELRRNAYDLVLVNRVLDYDGTEGLDLIRALTADEALRRVPVMLVSNHADAQHEAQAAGARPGFGKAALNRPETAVRLREILG
jgi:CheY-like chemotaxis protein